MVVLGAPRGLFIFFSCRLVFFALLDVRGWLVNSTSRGIVLRGRGHIRSTPGWVCSSASSCLYAGAEWQSSDSSVRQRSTTSPKYLRVSPVGLLVLLSVLPWPRGMGGPRWPGKRTGILLSPRHGAHHLGQPIFRLPCRPRTAHSRGALPILPSSVSRLFSFSISLPWVDFRLGAAGGWEQWSPLLLQPNVWGDVLGTSRAAEPVSPCDGVHECSQVSRGWTGKDSLAALL